MKSIGQLLCLISSIALMMPSKGISQNKSNTELIQAAKEIMNAAGTCALITLDQEGNPRARTMDPFAPEDDLTVWFGTNSNSRKVTQIKNNPGVTLYYLDKDASGYVTIHGTAEVVNDPTEKANRWKERWKDFYPNRPDGYSLIKVSPKWLEVISESRGILGDSVTWQPKAVVFDSEE